jgi:two-component system, cell cycle sensor histidine kinase and response regulator CckA
MDRNPEQKIEPRSSKEEVPRFEDSYRVLFECNPQPMWVFDSQTLAFLAVNEAAIHHYGYSREEFLSMTIKDIRPSTEVNNLLNRLSSVMPSHNLSGEWIHRKKDGTIIDVEIVSHSLIFNGREARLVLANDITARKQATQALKASEERLRLALEVADMGTFDCDLINNQARFSERLEQIYGLAPNTILSYESFIGILHPDDREHFRSSMEYSITEGVTHSIEFRAIRPDGNIRWITGRAQTYYDMNGIATRMIGVAIDITEQRRAEQALKESEEQLRQAQKMEAIGKLAGGIAHDFNNLLTAILVQCDFLLMQMKFEDPLHNKVLEIKKAGDRAAALTKQLLAFSRKQVLQPKTLRLNDIVSDLYNMLKRLIGEHIELIIVLDPDCGYVKADQGQVEQVIMNLVVNSRDAMPNGGKLTIETKNVSLDSIYARSHISVQPGEYVMVAISDNGVGMTDDTKRRIFEPFFTTKELGKGTGLGLSTVYGIVKQSGGNIWVYSELNQGTVFKIYLPRIEEKVDEEIKEEVSVEIPCGTETILLVEDEDMVRELTREILELYGYKILEAPHPDEAISICHRYNGPIHMMITDVVMPKISGKQLADRLSKVRPEMSVLYMSGYTDEAIVHHGMLDNNINFIQKPFTPETLAQTVRRLIRNCS